MLIPLGILASSGGAIAASSYELIETTILGSTSTSITFNVSGLGSTYKHLQIRFAARGNRSDTSEPLYMRLNSDTSTNYSWHSLQANGSTVSSDASGSFSYMRVGELSSANASANIFAGGVVDIVDAFSTSKKKTIRGLGGPSDFICLRSGAWYSTAAVTSITLIPWSGTSFTAASRFSIYGIKG